jgi:hypothetical protein
MGTFFWEKEGPHLPPLRKPFFVKGTFEKVPFTLPSKLFMQKGDARVHLLFGSKVFERELEREPFS